MHFWSNRQKLTSSVLCGFIWGAAYFSPIFNYYLSITFSARIGDEIKFGIAAFFKFI